MGGKVYQVIVTAADVYDQTAVANVGLSWIVFNPVIISTVPDQDDFEGNEVLLTVTSTNASNTLVTFTASGLPNGLAMGSGGIISGIVAAGASSGGNDGVYAVLVVATDANGASDAADFNWTINSPVVVAPISNPTNNEGDEPSLAASATDANGTTLTFSATGLPPGIIINATGVFGGNVAAGDGYYSPYSVTVTATNVNGSTGNTTFSWNIVNPLTVSPIENQTSDEGAQPSLTATANDVNGSAVRFYASGLPNGLTMNLTGAVSGTVAAGAGFDGNSGNNGVYNVTVYAIDDNGAMAQTQFVWTIVNPISIAPINNATKNEGDDPIIPVVATDANNAQMYFSASGLPQGLTIDRNTGIIDGVIATGASSGGNDGVYNVTVNVIDAIGAKAATSFVLLVLPANPITMDPIPDQASDEGNDVTLEVNATDANNGNLRYTADVLPDGLTIDRDTGTISGVIAAGTAAGGDNGVYFIKVTAADNLGNSAFRTFVWAITVPVFTLEPISTQTNAEGASVSISLTVKNFDPNVAVTYTAPGLPAGTSLNNDLAIITGYI